MFIVVFLIAATLGGALSLPSDWVRRAFRGPVRSLGEVAGGIVLVAVGAALAGSDLSVGVPGALSVLAGLIVGAVLADLLATRLWGRPVRDS